MLLIACVILTAACKKGDNNAASKENRIAAIKSSVYNYIYHYDDQNRLLGIDYSVSSKMKVAYSASGMVLQWYDGSDNPTDYKAEMNVIDGKVKEIKEVTGTHKINHNYNYDAEGRMMQATVVKTAILGNQIENQAGCIYTWSGKNLTRVLLQVADGNGAKTDSIIYEMNYYDGKNFITWEDLGLPVFGSAPIGGISNGFGWRLPVNFLGDIIPSAAAVQSISSKKYYKQNGQWSLSGGNSQYPESDYLYDDKGRLSKWRNGIGITWQ